MTDQNASNEAPVNMNELDPNFKDQVAQEPGGEHIKRCFACGTCSATCPVFEVNENYNPRKIIRMILLGMKDEVLESGFVWLCSGCYSCYELCPRDVKITDLMTAVRNLAVKEGYVPSAMKAQIDLLDQYGRLYEVSEFENQVREKKGMPVLEEKIPDIKKLLEACGIRKVVDGGAKDE